MRINGKEVSCEAGRVISYEELVALADMKGMPSITHAWTEHKHRLGETLSPGTTAVVTPTSVFNVCHTGNA